MSKRNNQNANANNVVLTVDVGLKNLALCVMDSKYNLHLWDVYNMFENEEYNHTCNSIKKDGEICNKKCQYKFNEIGNVENVIYSCKKHVPKEIVLEKKHFIKEKKVGDYLLQDITQRIMNKIREIYNNNPQTMTSITNICIELQPRVNQRMKFTSHIIYATFVDLYKDTNVTIRFIRASQNLQAYNGPKVECNLKSPYAKRKFLSVVYTKWYLEHGLLNTEFNINNNWLNILAGHSKKDDLCDVINANINVHKGLTKNQFKNKNNSEIK